jgi:hypothetical protein
MEQEITSLHEQLDGVRAERNAHLKTIEEWKDKLKSNVQIIEDL